MDIATRDERLRAAFLTLGLSPILTVGFIPTTTRFLYWIPYGFGFPLLAFVFSKSLPSPGTADRVLGRRFALRSAVIPLILSLAAGAVFHTTHNNWVWYVIAAPIGEELLFRGWVYQLFEMLWPRKFLTLTNPLPLSVWASATAFSLWHLQNWGTDPLPWVVFQCGYTFFVGIWLGEIRRRTGDLSLPILFHCSLNLCFWIF